MLSNDVLERIAKVAGEVATREGCTIYDIEFVGAGKGRTLRVYIEKPDGQAGIDDCSNVSRGLNLMLDVEDVIPGGAYNLEVSTPGLERALKKPQHFKTVIGKKIWFKTGDAFESFGVTDKKLKSAKQIKTQLQSCDDNGIEVLVEEQLVKIPYSAIEKASLVFEMEKGKKK